MKRFLAAVLILLLTASASHSQGLSGGGGGGGAAGPIGPTGPAGAAVLNGTANPTSQGNNNDFFINTNTSTIFGPKAAGAWPGSGTLMVGAVGATGAAGNTLRNGTGVPGSGVGVNGDFYLDTAANKMYGPKAAGAWPGTGTALVGPTGATGSAGATGPAGSSGNTVLNGSANPTGGQGNNGDYFINNTTTTIFGPKAAGAWPGSGTVLTGATGSAGAAGNTIRNGTGAPGSGVGANGDYYLDNATTILYGPKAAGAWPGSGTSLIGSGAGLTTANAWTNTNRTPSCALTDAATISVPAGCNVRTVTLGGNRTLADPTLSGGEWLTFLVTQDNVGTRLLNYGSTYVFSNNTPPTLTTTPGATDEIGCYAASATELKCPGFSPNVTQLPKLLGQIAGQNAAAGASLAVTLTSYSGRPLIIGALNCDGSGCTTAPAVATITSITTSAGNTCARVTGSTNVQAIATDIWVCGTGTAGSNTITLNCSGGAGCFYLGAVVSEWSKISGTCEVAAQNETTGTAVSLATSGATTVTNSVIFAFANGAASLPTAGNTLIGSSGSLLAEYQIGNALLAYTDSVTSGASQKIDMSIAACH